MVSPIIFLLILPFFLKLFNALFSFYIKRCIHILNKIGLGKGIVLKSTGYDMYHSHLNNSSAFTVWKKSHPLTKLFQNSYYWHYANYTPGVNIQLKRYMHRTRGVKGLLWCHMFWIVLINASSITSKTHCNGYFYGWNSLLKSSQSYFAFPWKGGGCIIQYHLNDIWILLIFYF